MKTKASVLLAVCRLFRKLSLFTRDKQLKFQCKYQLIYLGNCIEWVIRSLNLNHKNASSS